MEDHLIGFNRKESQPRMGQIGLGAFSELGERKLLLSGRVLDMHAWVEQRVNVSAKGKQGAGEADNDEKTAIDKPVQRWITPMILRIR